MKLSNYLVIFFLLLFTSLNGYSQQNNQQSTNLKLNIDSVGSPVISNGDTLFYLNIGYGSMSVEQRAAFISGQIQGVKDVFNPKEDKITLHHEKGSSLIKYNQHILIQITEKEAQVKNVSLDKLSQQWFTILNENLTKTISKKDKFLQYAISVSIILIALFIINYLLKKVIRKLNAIIFKRKEKYIKGIRIKDFEIMDAKDMLELVMKATFVLRVILMLIVANIVFPVIFSFFPATEFIAYEIFGLVLKPIKNFFHSIIAYIPNLFTIVVIVYVVRIILKYLKIASERVSSGRLKIKGFYPDWSKTTYDMLKVIIIALSFVMLFPYLPGAQSNVFKGVSVFIGVIFSLGSTSIVGNLIAGLVLTYMRPFKIGDRIRIGEIEGEIVEKTAFVIRIKTPKNEYITIPNSNVQASHITNFNKSISEGGVILFTDVTIGYEVPWRKVHELLLEAADRTPDLEKNPKPFVLQKGLDDYSVSYQINGYSKTPLYKDLIYSLLHQNIQDIFNEAQVEIMSPKYIASRDGNKTTIPPPKDNGPFKKPE